MAKIEIEPDQVMLRIGLAVLLTRTTNNANPSRPNLNSGKRPGRSAPDSSQDRMNRSEHSDPWAASSFTSNFRRAHFLLTFYFSTPRSRVHAFAFPFFFTTYSVNTIANCPVLMVYTSTTHITTPCKATATIHFIFIHRVPTFEPTSRPCIHGPFIPFIAS